MRLKFKTFVGRRVSSAAHAETQTSSNETPALRASSLSLPLARSERFTGAGASRSFRSPLARLLDAPQLARVVPHLAPETPHQLIRHVGPAPPASSSPGDTQQLTSVFDFDLWRSSAGPRPVRRGSPANGSELLVEHRTRRGRLSPP
jgi:hypothetical protein